MKKILLATTAVVALSASAAQAEINLDLGGYFKAYAGFADQDTNNVRDFDLARKSQIFFSGETTLDNGLSVGVHTELFGENNDGAIDFDTETTADNSVEESYLYLSGNWGRVNIGRENGAAYLLQVAAPGADANIDGQDIDFSFYNTGDALVKQDYQHSGPDSDAQYSDKITYLTPKFNGFQAGASYTPSYEEKTIGQNGAGMGGDNDADELQNLMEIGARYDGEMNGLGIHAGAGYSTAEFENEALNTLPASVTDDYAQWNAGLKFDYNSFGFGGAYETTNNALEDADTDTYTIGADYTYGATKFGASYFNSSTDVGAATDELDRYTVGAVYTYGPGMDFNTSVSMYDGDFDTVADNDATVFAVGTDVQF